MTPTARTVRVWSLLGLISFMAMIFVNAQAMQGHSQENAELLLDVTKWFGVLELPFLILCLVFAFLTAHQMRGGVFGRGLTLIAWGFLVMAIGHIHMQIDHFFDLNIFNALIGRNWGMIFWFVALALTWMLTGLGFMNIYKSSKK